MALPKVGMPAPAMSGMDMGMPSMAPTGSPAPGGMMSPQRPQLDKMATQPKVTQPTAKKDGSIFAPFGYDADGKPKMTPPPGWKYFAYDGTPVAPAPKTGGWQPGDKVTAVFGPEALAPDFADTGAEGADMYEEGLLSPDQVFLKVGAPLKIKMAPATKKTKGPDQRRSGAKIAM